MKKTFSFLFVLILLLGLFPVFAYADAIGGVAGVAVLVLPVLIIAVAVIVIAAILRRILRKKK